MWCCSDWRKSVFMYSVVQVLQLVGRSYDGSDLSCRLSRRSLHSGFHRCCFCEQLYHWVIQMSYRCSPSSGFYWSKVKITKADTPTIRMDCHPTLTNWYPNLCHPTILRRMPFLAQPSLFILAWDRHQICWLAYPAAKLWWLDLLNKISHFIHQVMRPSSGTPWWITIHFEHNTNPNPETWP